MCFALGTSSLSQPPADTQVSVSLGLRACRRTGIRSYLKTPALSASCKAVSEQKRLGRVFCLGRRASEGSEQTGDKRMLEAGVVLEGTQWVRLEEVVGPRRGGGVSPWGLGLRPARLLCPNEA